MKMESTIPAELLNLKARLDQWRANRKYLRISKLASISGEQTANIFVNPCPQIYGKRSSPSAGDIPALYCVAF